MEKQKTAICKNCGFEGNVSEFRTPHKKGKEKYLYYDYCKKCHGNNARACRYKLDYRITEEEYQKILKYQKGGCAICNTKPKKIRLSVDHDHKSGLIRGLLCWHCNNAIGKFKDKQILFWMAFCYFFSPPAVIALGEKRYGMIGKVGKKAKNRVYGGAHLETDPYKVDPTALIEYINNMIRENKDETETNFKTGWSVKPKKRKR